MESKKYGRSLPHYAFAIVGLLPVIFIFSIASEYVINHFLGKGWYFIHDPLDLFMEVFLLIVVIYFTYQENIRVDENGIWFQSGLAPWDQG